MTLKISIITPSYNQVSFIEQTIKSVVEQQYQNIEYIILDAKSTDGTVEIIHAYGDKYPEFIQWFSKSDNGQVDALNQGFSMATGDIVAFLNSDDFYRPGCFDAVNNYFESHPDKEWLVGNCGVIPTRLRWTFTFKNLWPIDKIASANFIFNFINQPAVFLRRSLIQRVGPLDYQYKLTFDYDYWLRCLKYSLPGRIHDELAVFRVQKNAKSTIDYRKEFFESYAIASSSTKNKLILFIHRLFIFIVRLIYIEAKGGL